MDGGELDKGSVKPAGGGGGGAARRATKQPAKTQSGPSKSFRDGIDDGSLCCMPGDSDDETADGESIWYVNALGPQEKNTVTFACGPCTLKKGNYSIPIQWLNLLELTDEYAIFEDWPTEQNRIAATHLLDMPDLKWAKVKDGRYYMSRAQYDACNEQL